MQAAARTPHPGARAAVLQQGGKRSIVYSTRKIVAKIGKEGDCMTIRRAAAKDMPRIQELLWQVELVHHAIRPDLFKNGGRHRPVRRVYERAVDVADDQAYHTLLPFPPVF